MRRKIDIEFADKKYTVAPTFAVIEKIEQKFDLMSYLRSVQAYRVRVKDVAWILYCAITESGDDIQYPYIGDLVLSDFDGATVAATDIVTEAISAGPEKKSKKKAGAVSQDIQG